MIGARKFYFLIALVATVFCQSVLAQKDLNQVKKPLKSEYVIVLVIDGPRYTETFGEPTQQYIPNFRDSLLPQGVFFPEFYNNGRTFTISGHTAITTGVYQNIRNNGLVLPKNPSLFQEYKSQINQDENSTYIISSKGKLSVLGNTKDKVWRDSCQPQMYCGINGSGHGYAADAKTFSKVLEILEEKHPVLTLINLLEVDVQGHVANYEGYLQGIRNTDESALKLWQFIQNDSVYANKTTLFITNDHGRHKECRRSGYISHGDGCSGCRHISLVALGPDFIPGTVIENEYGLIDLHETMAFMLGVDSNKGKGRVIKELFEITE
ncbi:MAG: hypothetical protein ACI9G9_000611 [Psychromonas sp.]|jgi:hypothetical protein